MGLVQSENIVEGMLLAADTHDRNGRLLLTKGTELTNRHIRMFQTWGISRIDILDSDDQQEQLTDCSNINPELLQKAETELLHQFRNNNLNHPVISELFRQCLTRKVQNENR